MAKKAASTEMTTTQVDPQAAQLEALKAAGFDIAALTADADAGNKNLTAQDIATPYLYVLQPLSPQAIPTHDAYIDGAEPGMFYNNAAQEVYSNDPGLDVVPCYYERKFVEWMDRKVGGGWVGEHSIDSDIMEFAEMHVDPIDGKKTLRLKSDPTHIIVETAYQYCMYRNPVSGLWLPIVIPMKSSMLKVNRMWNQVLSNTVIPGTGKKAPRWLYPFTLSTKPETDGKNTWHTLQVTRKELPVSLELYNQAKTYASLIESGQVERKAETVPTETDDVPFE